MVRSFWSWYIAFFRNIIKCPKCQAIAIVKVLDQSSFPTIKELSNQPLINMHAIVEIKPNGCPLVNKCLTTKIVYKKCYQHSASQIKIFRYRRNYIKRRLVRSETISGNWKPIKKEEKCFLLHLESSFRFKGI